jgi:hypothetical protein
MDEKPFLEFSLLDFDPQLITELKKFTKQGFDLEATLNTASELKYTKEIKRIMTTEMNSPSDEFIRFFVSKVYSGRLTQAVKEQFADIVKRALGQFINERINERLKSALVGSETANGGQIKDVSGTEVTTDGEGADDIVTTEEELEGFLIVRAILRELINVRRIVMRDKKGYCGILLDNNNRKPICRLYLASTQKYLGVFVFDGERKEKRISIEDINDIYQHADELKSAVLYYDAEGSPQPRAQESP